jgi:hypothetical protein
VRRYYREVVRLGESKHKRFWGVISLTLYLDLPQVSIMSSLENIQELCVNVPYSDLAINIVRRKADPATNQGVSGNRNLRQR